MFLRYDVDKKTWEIRKEAMLQAAGAICNFCGQGFEPRKHALTTRHIHDGLNGDSLTCYAHKIHDLIESVDPFAIRGNLS